MSGVKTAISIEKDLFEKIETTAEGLNISRSRFFTLASTEYLKKLENEALLKKINEVYGKGDQEEPLQKMIRYSKKQQKKMHSGEKW